MSGTNDERSSLRHEPALQRFDAAWRAGATPKIDDFLPADGPERQRILVELARIDLEHRLKAGETVRVEEYQRRYSQLADDATAVLGLIEVEYEQRLRAEPGLSPSEYHDRFPHLRDRLSGHMATLHGDGRDTSLGPIPNIAGYQIEGVLGRGGMGVVYKARQVGLDRLVALKMILSGREDSDTIVRFRTEAQAVAALHHPNIVQVHEVGEHDGRPYFSMEFVAGGSLADTLAATPQTPFVAAGLVEVMARAIEAAHAHGIVHRDLKPANVLIHDPAQPESLKITDFGLAKRLEGESSQTHTGAVLGTPSYMAPEQAGGRIHEVGPRSDVYALGAILYECLTGRAPFKGATAWDTIGQVLSQEPVPPARLQPGVPRDLDTICLKCLEKEPSRRYRTAAALADDLARFIRGEPVLARPVSLIERGWRWARRNPRVAGLIAALFLVLATGLTAVTVLWRLADSRRVAAEAASLKWLAERDRATAARARTRTALDDMTSQDTLEWLKSERRLLREQKMFLDRALKYYAEFAAESATDEDAQQRLASAQFRVGLIQQTLGQHAEAESAYRQAASAYETLIQSNPTSAGHREALGLTLNNLATALADQGRHTDAEAMHRKALDVRQRLSEEHPNVPSHLRDLAQSHYNLASRLRHNGSLAAAMTAHTQALSLREQLVRDHPDERANRELADSLNELALLLALQGKAKDAETAHRRAIDLQQKLADDHPEVAAYRVVLADSLHNLAILLDDLDKTVDSEKAHRRAAELRERLADEFPAVPVYRRKLANGLTSYGSLLSKLGRRPEAEAAHRRAQAQYDRLISEHPGVPEYRHLLTLSIGHLATILRDTGATRESEAAYGRGIDLCQKLADEYPTVPKYQQQLAAELNGLANLLAGLNRRADAEAAYRRSQAVYDRLHREQPDVPVYQHEFAASLNNLAILLRNDRAYPKAEQACRQSLELRERLVATHPNVPGYQQGLANSLDLLADLLNDQGKKSEAVATCRRCLEIRERLAKSHPNVLVYRQRLASSYVTLGSLIRPDDPPAALDLFAKAIAALEPAFAKDPRLANTRHVMSAAHLERANAFMQLGRANDADAEWDRSLELAAPANKSSVRLKRAASLARYGDKSRAITEAGALSAEANASAATLYTCAAIHARAHSPDRAIELLRRAIEKGFSDRERLKTDRDFESLRDREDFKRLVEN